jgi:CHAT domain-containing protein
MPPALALRSAQAWMRDPARPADSGPALPELPAGVPASHPWYWAPFLFVGA